MSNLRDHAEREMRLAGLYDKDADYSGMIPPAVLALIDAHAAQGHSGMSHALVLAIFNKLVNFKPLTPITANPEEWTQVDDTTWQSKRCPSVFSHDGMKTWRDIAEPERSVVRDDPDGHRYRLGRMVNEAERAVAESRLRAADPLFSMITDFASNIASGVSATIHDDHVRALEADVAHWRAVAHELAEWQSSAVATTGQLVDNAEAIVRARRATGG